MRRGIWFALLPFWAATAWGQVKTAGDFAGRWAAEFNGQKVVLDLHVDPQQPTTLAGSVTVGPNQSAVLGTVDRQTGQLSGAIVLQKAPDGKPQEFRDYLQYLAEIQGVSLILNVSFQAGAQQFELRRDGAAPVGPAAAPAGPAATPAGLAGRWHGESQGQAIDLTLTPGDGGPWSGTLLLGGTALALVGRLDAASGQVQGAVQLEPVPAGTAAKEFVHFVYFVAQPQADGAQLSLKLQGGDRTYPLKRPAEPPAGAPPAGPPPAPGAPAAFAGDYTFENQGQTVTLRLEAAADGTWRGVLGLGGGQLPLTAKLDPARGVLQGVIQTGAAPAGTAPREYEHFVYFVAETTAAGVTLRLKLQAGERLFPMQRKGGTPPANPLAPAGPTAGNGLGGLFQPGGNPPAAQPPAHEWAGEYSFNPPEGGTATLVLQPSQPQPGSFAGTVTLGQQALPLVAKPGERGTLVGVIQARKTADGQAPKEFEDIFYFVAEPTDDGLKLVVKFQNGEQSFAFKRQAKAAPRNPLGL